MGLNASISATGSKNHHSFTLYVEETSFNINTNKSTIYYKLTANASSYDFNYNSKSILYCLNVGGNYSEKRIGTYPKNSAWIVFEGYCDVEHSNDGTLNMYYAFSVNDFIGASYTTGDCSSSSYITLSTIPRASQPSCITYPQTTENVGDIGNEITIHMNRKSTNFTHTVSYSWFNKNAVIATGVEDNCSFTIPMDFCNDIPNDISGWGTITVETFAGTQSIGTNSVTFIATVPNSVKPTFTDSSYIQTNEAIVTLTGSNQAVVQNNSTIKVIITGASGSYGSTITKYCCSLGNKLYTSTTNEIIIDNIPENLQMCCYVTDSRKNRESTKNNKAFSIYYPYLPASITEASIQRVTDVSEKAKVNFKTNISSIILNNGTITLTYKYKEAGGYYSDEIAITSPAVEVQNYSFELPQDYSVDKNYYIAISIEDTLATEAEVTELLLQTAKPELSIRNNKIGINCIPIENNGTIQVANVWQPVIVESGYSNNWYFEKYDNGVAKSYGHYDYSLTLNGSNNYMKFNTEGHPTENNLIFPLEFIEIPCLIASSINQASWDCVIGDIKLTKEHIYSIAIHPIPVTENMQASGTLNMIVIGKWK